MKNRLFTPNDEKIAYDYKTIDKGHHLVTYRGVKAQRSPFDYVIYQMIISAVQPDLVVEIGTNFGGGALYIADLFNNLGKGEIHSIDISDTCPALVKNHPRIKLFHEGWEKYDLSLTQGFNKILVIEDSSHTYENTLNAVRKFCSIVSPGSYLVVEDGIVDQLGASKYFNGGPCRAIREFLQENNEFEVDRHYCDFFGKNATNNVNGYLKKRELV